MQGYQLPEDLLDDQTGQRDWTRRILRTAGYGLDIGEYAITSCERDDFGTNTCSNLYHRVAKLQRRKARGGCAAMPHVTIAMERSVRRGVVDILRDSWLAKRADTSSSDSGAIGLWNKCMANEICQ